ncbi:MAG: DUF615 domain-containing protein [Gammaproteobacteria bacterium]|nr:DUF615 domain-containing protein [Gammaproteobacteria bacterium]
MGKKDRQFDEDGLVIRINKEEEKRKRDEIKAFVKELLKLANDKYSGLPIDITLRNALEEGKRLSGNAYKRHLSFIVRLVHEQGFDEIVAVHERLHHPYRNDPGKIREIENYRDRLLGGDKEVINELLAKFADVDIQYVRQLARNVSKEHKEEIKRVKAFAEKHGQPYIEPNKPTKSAKALYQYLFKLNLL